MRLHELLRQERMAEAEAHARASGARQALRGAAYAEALALHRWALGGEAPEASAALPDAPGRAEAEARLAALRAQAAVVRGLSVDARAAAAARDAAQALPPAAGGAPDDARLAVLALALLALEAREGGDGAAAPAGQGSRVFPDVREVLRQGRANSRNVRTDWLHPGSVLARPLRQQVRPWYVLPPPDLD